MIPDLSDILIRLLNILERTLNYVTMNKIETKFKVGDWVRPNIHRNAERIIIGYKVLEVFTQTCYAGTQVFYDCRAYQASQNFKDDNYAVGIGINQQGGNKVATHRFRQDELITMPDNELNVILEGKELKL